MDTISAIRSRILLIFLLFLIINAFSNTSFALVEKEKEYEIAVAKGILHIETGEYAEAVKDLKKALEHKPRDKAATLSLGIAYSRSGDLQSAKNTLRKASEIDRTDSRTMYELGLVSYRLGETADARNFFSGVAKSADDDRLTEGAERYLDLIEAAEGNKKGSAFALTILAGMQQDTNVLLEPTAPRAAGEKKSDWRAVAMLEAGYTFLQKEGASAKAGYSFYQSMHDRLHAFNVQQHALSLGGALNSAADLQADLHYRFSYSLVGGHHYSDMHRISPALSYKISPSQSGELYFARENKKFFASELFQQNIDRSGNNDTLGMSYRIEPQKRLSLIFGYAYDRDSPAAAWWVYTGQKVSVGLNAEVEGIGFSAGLSSYDQQYKDLFPGFTDKRHDRVQEFSLNLDRKIVKSVSLVLSELYIRHRSTIGPYDYSRNIVGLFAVISL